MHSMTVQSMIVQCDICFLSRKLDVISGHRSLENSSPGKTSVAPGCREP